MTIPGFRCVSPLWAQSGETVPLFAHFLSNIACRGFEYFWRSPGVSLYKPPLVKMFLYLYWFWQMSLAKILVLGSFLWKKNERGMAIYLHRMCVPNTVAESLQSFPVSSKQKSGAREKPERRQKNTFWYVSRFQKVGYTATTLVIILNKKRYNSRLGCDRFCETNKLNFPGRCYFWSYILCGYAA